MTECGVCFNSEVSEWYSYKCNHKICENCHDTIVSNANYLCPFCRCDDRGPIFEGNIGNILEFIDTHYNNYDPPITIKSRTGAPDVRQALLKFIHKPNLRYIIMTCNRPYKKYNDMDIITNIKSDDEFIKITYAGWPMIPRKIEPRVFDAYPLLIRSTGWCPVSFEGITTYNAIYLHTDVLSDIYKYEKIWNDIYGLCGGSLTFLDYKFDTPVCLYNS